MMYLLHSVTENILGLGKSKMDSTALSLENSILHVESAFNFSKFSLACELSNNSGR